ncbi:MAG: S4 domain-containing protein [Myxococcota bacterium]
MIHRFVVADEAATERLDRYLSTQLGETISRAQIQRLITERHVLVDGAAAKPSFRVGPSMTVSVELPPPAPTELIPEPVPLDVLFEDADLIAVAKPAGMPVHPGAGHRKEPPPRR